MHNFIIENGLQTKIYLSRVETENKEADKEFLDYWKSSGLANHVFIRDFIPIEENRETYSKNPCIVPWKGFNINIDGMSVVCFNQLFKNQSNPEMVLGDVNKQKQ